ncbi:hypothetical protein ACFO5Q_05195 [Kordiimonas lipolytica]|uniref:Uncharacterized protein n=1 Tax=Kordiimonas lipolytica TaxID=1662421 RepID=A0ABV8U8S8_9PROT|nr:hypothetical protein [Kordiimonas lipolytica]
MTALQGYRELGRRDFAASRLAAFGMLGHQKIKLKKRPVRRLFALPQNGPRYLDISFVTDQQEMARGAVDVTIRYRGMRGVALRQPVVHRLFADPADQAGVQRLWLDPPKRAMFAEVSFSRAVRGQQVALDGRLKLGRAPMRPGLDLFDEVVASRDLSAMHHLLEDLVGVQDRTRARALLARICFLSHDPRFARSLQSLDDAERILAFGPNDCAPGVPLGQNVYLYDRSHLRANLASLPLGKALRREARCLVRDLRVGGSGGIKIPQGYQQLGRLLVAVMVKRQTPELTVELDWEAFRAAPQGLGDWLVFDTGASFLETPGGQVVQSCIAP